MEDERIDIDSLIELCENSTKLYAQVEENSYTEYIQNNIVNNFYYSVLYILYDEFRNLTIEKKQIFIDDWKNEIYKLFKKNKRKYKKEDVQIILNCLLTRSKSIVNQIIQVIVDIQDINIYIVNYSKHTIKVFYSKDSLNIYKKNIFIESKNNVYYPIMNNNNGIFCANNNIIQQIKNNDSMFTVSRSDGSNINFLSKSEIENSYDNNGLDNDTKELNNSTADNLSIKEYISKKNLKFNKTGLSKIKIGELKEICCKYNIDIEGKKKSEIVEKILQIC